jgi:membrane-bound lytic murein transglycosylase D
MKWNHLSHKSPIKTGQNLVVWSKDAAKKLPIAKTGAGFKPSQSIEYTVREGDSLFAISKRFNVTVADLRKWNGTKVDKQFKPGLNLTVSGEKE